MFGNNLLRSEVFAHGVGCRRGLESHVDQEFDIDQIDFAIYKCLDQDVGRRIDSANIAPHQHAIKYFPTNIPPDVKHVIVHAY